MYQLFILINLNRIYHRIEKWSFFCPWLYVKTIIVSIMKGKYKTTTTILYSRYIQGVEVFTVSCLCSRWCVLNTLNHHIIYIPTIAIIVLWFKVMLADTQLSCLSDKLRKLERFTPIGHIRPFKVQIWVHFGPASLNVMTFDRKSPGYVSYCANLTYFGPKSDTLPKTQFFHLSLFPIRLHFSALLNNLPPQLSTLRHTPQTEPC